MNQPFYGRYRARCIRVIDGDTVDAVVDVGFRLNATLRLRLWGINTPEMTDKDPVVRALAVDAKEFVMLKLSSGQEWPLRIETFKDTDNFGRWLAKIWYGEPETFLNDELVALGFAVEYRR